MPVLDNLFQLPETSTGTGTADVIVGAQNFDTTESQMKVKCLFILFIKRTSSSFNWTAEGNQIDAKFGSLCLGGGMLTVMDLAM